MTKDHPIESFFWRNYKRFVELRNKYRVSGAYSVLLLVAIGGVTLLGGDPWFLDLIVWATVQFGKFFPIDPVSFDSDTDTNIQFGGFVLAVLAMFFAFLIYRSERPKVQDQFDITFPNGSITFGQSIIIISNEISKAIVLEDFTEEQKDELMTCGKLCGDDYIQILEALRDRANNPNAIPAYDVVEDNARIIIRPRR